jgi:hypothetical protein
MESMAVVVAAVESVAIVNAAIVSAAKVSAVIVSAAMVSAARWRARGEDLDEAAASAATSVGGTSLGAPVSRLALSGRPPRPLLMRIACSISLSYNVRVHSRPAGGRAGSCQRVSVARLWVARLWVARLLVVAPIIPKRTMRSLPQSVSGTMYKSKRSQIPIQISTPETIETEASSTARGSK